VGVVSEGNLLQLARRAWRSRLATAGLLGTYAVWLGSGLWLGVAELRDKDKIVPVRVNFSAKRREWIELEGEATLYTLRKERRACTLVRESRLSIDRSDERPCALHLLLACDNVSPEARLTVFDSASGRSHAIDDLRPYRTEVSIPLPSPNTCLRFVPSIPNLRYSFRELRIDAAGPDARFHFEPRWNLVHETPTHRIEHGTGFHDRPGGSGPENASEPLAMRQIGYLKITPRIANAKRVVLVYRKVFDSYSDPVVWLGGRRAGKDRLAWSRGSRGVTSLEIVTDLDTPAIVGLELPERVTSPSELGINEDPRRLSYVILVDSCAVLAPK